MGGRLVIIIAAICVFSTQFGVTAIATPLAWWVVKRFETTWLVSSLIFSAFTIASTLLEFPGGVLSDRIGRKPLIIGGLILYAVASVLFPFSRAPSELILARLLQGAGAGLFFPAITALITETTRYEDRGEAMCIYNIGMGAGMAVGPAAGGFLFTIFNIFVPFYLCAGFALLSLLLVLFLVYEPTRGVMGRIEADIASVSGPSATVLSERGRQALTLACVIIFFGIGVASIMTPIFAPFAASELMLSLPFARRLDIIGLILSTMLAVFAVLQVFFNRVMQRTGEINLSLLGLLLCALGMLFLYFATAPVELFVISGVLGAGLGALSLGTLTLASKSAGGGVIEGHEGKVMGIYYTFFYAGLGAIPLLCGWTADISGSGPRMVFLSYSLLLFILCIVLRIAIWRMQRGT